MTAREAFVPVLGARDTSSLASGGMPCAVAFLIEVHVIKGRGGKNGLV